MESDHRKGLVLGLVLVLEEGLVYQVVHQALILVLSLVLVLEEGLVCQAIHQALILVLARVLVLV